MHQNLHSAHNYGEEEGQCLITILCFHSQNLHGKNQGFTLWQEQSQSSVKAETHLF